MGIFTTSRLTCSWQGVKFDAKAMFARLTVAKAVGTISDFKLDESYYVRIEGKDSDAFRALKKELDAQLSAQFYDFPSAFPFW